MFGVDLDLTGGCTSPTWTGDICLSYNNTKGNPENDTYIYTPGSPYNGQPVWILASQYIIRWEGSMWEIFHTITGEISTGGPGSLCSPAGTYTGSVVSNIAFPATAVEGTCPP